MSAEEPVPVPCEIINETIGQIGDAHVKPKAKRSAKKTQFDANDAVPHAVPESEPKPKPKRKRAEPKPQPISEILPKENWCAMGKDPAGFDVVPAVTESVKKPTVPRKRKVAEVTESSSSESGESSPEVPKPKKSRKKAVVEGSDVPDANTFQIPIAPWTMAEDNPARGESEKLMRKLLLDVQKRFDAKGYMSLHVNSKDEDTQMKYGDFLLAKARMDGYLKAIAALKPKPPPKKSTV